jgi:hypothetical protein
LAWKFWGNIEFCQEQGELERQGTTWIPFPGGSLPSGLALIDFTDRRTRLFVEIFWNFIHVMRCSNVFSGFPEYFFLCVAASDKVAINTDIPAAKSFFHF